MKKIICLIMALLMLVPYSSYAEETAEPGTYIYVSPHGNDSGTGAETAPFRTIERARDEVRKINKSMQSDVYVILKSGKYVIDKPIEFTNEDSGFNGHRVIYRGENGAVVTGTKKIEGFELHDSSKNIWKAPCDVYSRQVYVNSKRAIRSRSPEGTVPNVTKTDKGYTISAADPLLTYKNPTYIDFFYKIEWQVGSLPIKSINGTDITMADGFANEAGHLLWIENAYELIDQEGEWYIDRNEKMLYYKPLSGEDMKTADVEVPTVEHIIKASGTKTDYMKNISFENIEFMGATWMGPSSDFGYPQMQAGFTIHFRTVDDRYIKSALNFSYAENIEFTGNTVHSMGGVGVWFDIGCKNNVVRGNDFYDINSSAVNIGIPAYNDPPEEDALIGNIIDNNHIHEVGIEHQGSAALFTAYTAETEITHNYIHDIPYSGISNGWGWKDFFDSKVCHDNKIQNNLIHDVMTYLRDGAGIYNLGPQPNLEISGNVVYNVLSEFGMLYYLDNGSRWITVENNIGYNGAAAMYTKGGDNTVRNNYFDSSYETGIIGDQKRGHAEEGSNTIENNTVVRDGYYPTSIRANAGLEYEYQKLLLKGSKDENILKNAECAILNETGDKLLSASTGSSAANATDGSLKTSVKVGTKKNWILESDLKYIRNIDSISVSFKDGSVPESFKILGTVNGTDWEELYNAEENTAKDILAENINKKARFIRIALQKGSMSISEISAFANDFISSESDISDLPFVTFDDIAESPYKEDIEYMAAMGYVSGFDSKRFMPENPVTRGEFIVMLVRSRELQKEKYSETFADVTSDMWYADYIQAAAANGLITKGGNLRPEDAATTEYINSILKTNIENSGAVTRGMAVSAIRQSLQGAEEQ